MFAYTNVRSVIIGLCLILPTAYAVSNPDMGDKADAIYTNGKVYTVNKTKPWVEAFAVKDGKFMATGSNADISSLAGPNTIKNNLEGRFITPGFIDTHLHSVAGSILTAELTTADLTTNEEMYKRLRQFAEANPDRTKPLIAYGWHLVNFGPEGPHKNELDEIFGDLPVLFVRSDGHGAWANTAAFKAAGVTKDTPDPSKASYYQRNDAGELTGYIEEIPAYYGVYDQMIGDISEEWLGEIITKAFPNFPSVGLTTVFDPGVLFADAILSMNAIHKFNEKYGPVMRVSMSHYSLNYADDFEKAQALVANSKSEHVFSDSIKINVDQSIETGTGFLKEPYIEGSLYAGSKGMTVYSPEELNDIVDKCYANGINMHFHVVGDAGTDIILDAMEAAIAKHGEGGPRGNITHAMMVDPADMPRLTPANTGISFSPLWMMPGPPMDVNTEVIGQKRSDDFYPAGRVSKVGGKVGIGSDFPVAITFPSYAPLDSVEMFITRAHAGEKGAAMQGHEYDKLTLEDAIEAATIDNAWLMNKEKELGSIETGKSADFVVLEKNLFEVPSHEISKVKVLKTFYRGSQTYSAE